MLKRPCHYFNTTGKCHFGKRCRFLHDPDILRAESENNLNSENGSLKSGSSPHLESRHTSISYESKQENHEVVNLETITSDVSSVSISKSSDTSTDDDGRLNGAKEENSAESGVCKYYARYKFCRYGKQCKYQHLSKKRSEKQGNDLNEADLSHGGDENKVQDEGDAVADVPVKSFSRVPKSVEEPEPRKKQSKRVCFFYKQGYCRKGRKCNFLHPGWNSPDKQKENIKKVDQNQEKPEKSAAIKVQHLPHCYKKDEVTPEKIEEMRAIEIRQLKRRFTSDKLRCVEETETNTRFVFTFSPTDPDWPFEVKVFDIAVEFTNEYPLKVFNLSVPEEQDLPETVRRYIEVSLEEWVKMKQEQQEVKGTVELLFRPFLRWLDSNMEELVTQALKQLRRELTAQAAGLQFITAKELKKERKDSTSDAEDTNNTTAAPEILEELGVIVYRKSEKEKIEEVYEVPKKDGSSEEEDDTDSDEDIDETEHKRPQMNPDTERRGTELSFRNMQIWFCTTVMMEKLVLTVQCERCKNTTDFSTPPNRVNSIACGKCHSVQLVVFRPVLAHSYCSTFGYLDLDGCTVFDVNMQECHFSMGCITCHRDVLVKHCTPGKLLEPFCRLCHNKMQFASESIKMTRLTYDVDQSYFSGKVHQVNARTVKKASKDPAIQDGNPLPNNGACKHYKKSFRWLRFPCCGKCYPCDVCHDDKEDHEMKYANRMICGFCCREQPYAAEKPCLGCSSALTKVRTSFWEGGKGCRDKISMSRHDNQKYANMSKTESRRSQALKEKSKGKKNTKLRHT